MSLKCRSCNAVIDTADEARRHLEGRCEEEFMDCDQRGRLHGEDVFFQVVQPRRTHNVVFAAYGGEDCGGTGWEDGREIDTLGPLHPWPVEYEGHPFGPGPNGSIRAETYPLGAKPNGRDCDGGEVRDA